MNKEYRDQLKLAKVWKYKFLSDKGKHRKWIHTINGNVVVSPKTSSDCRSMKNLEKQFKRSAA